MNFLELCQRRRSFRQYTDQPVEQDKIDYLLRCALMSPAGKRLNPWEFYVVNNPSILRAMAACKPVGAGMFKTAMAAIIVCADASKSDTWMCDASIAAEHIMLAAAEQGLGSCWCHLYGRDEAQQVTHELVGIPANLTALCAITLGYKNEDRQLFVLDKLQYEKIHNA